MDGQSLQDKLQIMPAQLAQFTKETLRVQKAIHFDVNKLSQKLTNFENQRVLAIDLGGGKLATAFFKVAGGELVEDGESASQHLKSLTLNSRNGAGYLNYLEELSAGIKERDFLVGVSTAGVTEGSMLTESPNLSIFVKELGEAYGGDFHRLFGERLVVVNDAVAGIAAASLMAEGKANEIKNSVFVVNGGGLGGAVLAQDVIWSAEPGHVKLVDGLNFFNQEKLCKMADGAYVCIENVAASGAGIEDLWMKERSESATGEVISGEYLTGDVLAVKLYDVSAFLTAHALLGLLSAFGLLETANETLAVLHGGTFSVPGYADKVMKYTIDYLGFEMPFMLSKEIGKNLSLYGAAYLAISQSE